MNADDFNSVKEWFSTHSRDSFQMADPYGRSEVLSGEIDLIKLNHEITVRVLVYLEDQADSWLYVLQDNGHIGVCRPDLDTEKARDIIEVAENKAKAELRVEGYALLEVEDKTEYDEEVHALIEQYPEEDQLGSTGSGKLREVLNELHRTCGCWVPSYVVRGLHRNGTFLKPDTPRRDTVDLQLWRWNHFLVAGIDS